MSNYNVLNFNYNAKKNYAKNYARILHHIVQVQFLQ